MSSKCLLSRPWTTFKLGHIRQSNTGNIPEVARSPQLCFLVLFPYHCVPDNELIKQCSWFPWVWFRNRLVYEVWNCFNFIAPEQQRKKKKTQQTNHQPNNKQVDKRHGFTHPINPEFRRKTKSHGKNDFYSTLLSSPHALVTGTPLNLSAVLSKRLASYSQRQFQLSLNRCTSGENCQN